MIKKIKNKILKVCQDSPGIPIGIIIIILMIVMIIMGYSGPLGGRSGGGTGEMLTTATSNLSATWTNHPVFSGSAILNKIAIGQYSAGGQIAVFDSITGTGTDSIIFFATASSAQVWELDLKMDTGIMVNTTDQNNAMLFYTPD